MKTIGRALTLCGAILVAFYGVARMHALVGSNVALAQFPSSVAAMSQAGSGCEAGPDMALWSEGRITAFRDSLGLAFDPPLAVLRIPRLGLEAPILRGTDEASLNRGLGWIEGMTLPGGRGNVGVAGHRDGFFRVLKDVAEGDVIELVTGDGVVEYLVTSTRVIEPDELQVLAPTESPVLTLVTCYPFYFVGSAPQRFIVRAVPKSEIAQSASGAAPEWEGDGKPVSDQRYQPGVSQQSSTRTTQQPHGGTHQ